jgi:FkbM family methyltransferase
MSAPPFGALAPSPGQERIRELAHRLPANYFGRRAASLLLGPAGGRSRRAFDVTVFGSERARLHPFDNICEKRVFLTPQLWDGAERALLGEVIGGFAGRTFHFVDVGANAGLYTLFARAEARRAGANFRAACIEPDPVMQARLGFNLGASGAADETRLFSCAAAAEAGTLRLAVNEESRGESRLAPEGLEVAARPLVDIVGEAGFAQVDALKIDIEGAEAPVLAAFFASAPRELRPGLILMEISHGGADNPALDICRAAGYEIRLRTRMNAGLVPAG